MPKPYSYDLRQKVVQAIKLDGLKISEASQIFSISRDTIRLWLKRERETGEFQALPNKPGQLRSCRVRSNLIKHLPSVDVEHNEVAA